jgi:hypothetical protein
VLLSVGVDVERFENELGNASLSLGASSDKDALFEDSWGARVKYEVHH